MSEIDEIKQENQDELEHCAALEDDKRAPVIKPLPFRKRRTESRRHAIGDHFVIKDTKGNLFQKKDLCWLAKSWRQKHKEYIPCLREVLEAILKEVSDRFNKLPDLIPRRQFTGYKLDMEKPSNELMFWLYVPTKAMPRSFRILASVSLE